MFTKDLTQKCLRRLVLGWLLAALVEALAVRPALAGVAELAKMKLLRLVLITAGIAAALFFSRWETAERWGIPAAFAALAAVSLKGNFRPSFLQACLLILILLVAYALLGWNGETAKEKKLPAKCSPKAQKGIEIASLALTAALAGQPGDVEATKAMLKRLWPSILERTSRRVSGEISDTRPTSLSLMISTDRPSTN